MNLTSGLSFSPSANPIRILSATGAPFTGNASSSLRITPSNIPAPEAPDMSELMAAYAQVPGMFNPRRLLKNMDSAITASREATAQQGRNAGRAYATRLMQTGLAPMGAGVVEAQARRAGMENTRALMTERESLQLQAKKESMNLRSMIANNLAGLRNDYVKTLADYNAKQATLEQSANATNAGTGLKLTELQAMQDMQAQRIAATAMAGGAGAGGIAPPQDMMTPGYIPTFGPITPATVNGRTLHGQVISPASVAAMGYHLS